MAAFLFLPIAFVPTDTPTKQFHFLASVFAGILMCKIVYNLTASFSLSCFKGYAKLNGAQKVEWNNRFILLLPLWYRGFSTFHALFAAFASIYLLLLSGLFDEDSQGELIVNRTSILSNSTLGEELQWSSMPSILPITVWSIQISLGYFISDLAMILRYFPALGGMEYVLHHGLSMFSIILSLLSGQGQIYILMVLFSEITTPFVNLRWHLDVAGRKSSTLYIWNGVLLFLGWLVARILLFIFFFTHMFAHFDQVKQIFPLGFYCLLAIPSVLAMMNLFWFWKIAKGLIKTISKARHSQ